MSDGKGIKRKVIACGVITEELRAKLPAYIDCETLDSGLHSVPGTLKSTLQVAIDKSEGYDEIVLGYGLCGMAVIGLCSASSTLVIPRADDCVTIVLGSRQAHQEQQRKYPGSMYLFKGWVDGKISDGSNPSSATYYQWVQKYGEKRAQRLQQVFYGNCGRMAFITTGESNLDEYREVARKRADNLNLRYEEIPGCSAMIEKIANGIWDQDFVVIPPGHPVMFEDFLTVSSPD